LNAWIDQVHELRNDREELMLVTVAHVRGSAPREVGAKMIVTPRQCIGSIGGGQLEYQCARVAAEALQGDMQTIRFRRRYPLGAGLGQCCGGVVEILFERIAGGECRWFDELLRLYRAREPVVIVTTVDDRYLVTESGVFAASESATPEEIASIVSMGRSLLRDRDCRANSLDVSGQLVLFEPVTGSGMNIAIFGAGHVGSACVAALSAIDCCIRWVDSRRNIFPQAVPACVIPVECQDPVLEVAAIPPGSFCLVMTHSHALDYAICHQVLKRGDLAYCGLIGSMAKRRRFEKLMRDADLPKAALAQLTCPIGIAGISGKKPAEIAIAVIAELLQIRDASMHSQAYDHRQPPLVVVSESGKK
jgi:xanthine dehydrogenase accessory factor